MSRRKNVSLRFIAEKCGVSTATVSRVLNSDPRVTEETRELVRKVLEEYHYTAPPVKNVHVQRIGAIIPSSYAEYYQALLRHTGRYFRQFGIVTIAVNIENTEGSLEAALKALYDCTVSGIVLIGCDCLSVRNVLSRKIPHVWIDCNDPAEDVPDCCTVESDQLVAGQLAAREFLRAGCRRPIILTGSHPSHRNKRRVKGFSSVFSESGFPVEGDQIIALPEIKPHVTEGQDIVRYLLTKGDDFDGIFAISDGRAIGAYMGLQRMGKKIPQEVRLMAFDGIAEANVSVLGITSIQQNVQLLAKNAGEMLLRQIRREEVTEKHILVPADILPGQTM